MPQIRNINVVIILNLICTLQHTGRAAVLIINELEPEPSQKTAKCQRQFVYFRLPSSTSPGRPAILIDPLAADTPEGRRRPKCLSSTLNFSSHCNCEMPWHFIFILFGQRSILSAISLAYFSPHFLWGNQKKNE